MVLVSSLGACAQRGELFQGGFIGRHMQGAGGAFIQARPVSTSAPGHQRSLPSQTRLCTLSSFCGLGNGTRGDISGDLPKGAVQPGGNQAPILHLLLTSCENLAVNTWGCGGAGCGGRAGSLSDITWISLQTPPYLGF